MESFIVIGLIATVLITSAWNVLVQRPQPPQIIYVQTAPAETGSTGCMPLIILIAVIIFAISSL